MRASASEQRLNSAWRFYFIEVTCNVINMRTSDVAKVKISKCVRPNALCVQACAEHAIVSNKHVQNKLTLDCSNPLLCLQVRSAQHCMTKSTHTKPLYRSTQAARSWHLVCVRVAQAPCSFMCVCVWLRCSSSSLQLPVCVCVCVCTAQALDSFLCVYAHDALAW